MTCMYGIQGISDLRMGCNSVNTSSTEGLDSAALVAILYYIWFFNVQNELNSQCFKLKFFTSKAYDVVQTLMKFHDVWLRNQINKYEIILIVLRLLPNKISLYKQLFLIQLIYYIN